MSAENRLTVDQLAGLGPGDPVVIEISGDSRRPRHSTGTVVRREGPHLVVSCRSPRGVPYVHRFGLRDGVRVGGGHRAELVTADIATPATSEQRRLMREIDVAYRAWAARRTDLEKLRHLNLVTGESLERLAALSGTEGASRHSPV